LARLGRPDEAALARRRAKAAPLSRPRELALHAADLRLAGKPDAALAVLMRALEVSGGDVWLWFDRGLCQEALGDDGGAAASYSTCLALLPEALPARFRRGVCQLRRQHFALALGDLDRVVAGRTDLVEAHINRALARAGLGQRRGALADLDTALQAGAPYTRVYFLRAGLREQLGDRAGARADRAEGMRRRPVDALSWVTRALARMDAEPHAALADLDAALALNPRERAALQNRAHVLAEKLNRPGEALASLDRLVTLGDDVLVRAGRGVLLARLRRREEAHAEIRGCLARRPSAAVLYRAGCVFALTAGAGHPADRAEAIGYLDSALRLGYGHHLLQTDRDLNALRQGPDFQALLKKWDQP
jgi:tetratricopeptide (TPR) repeat protein